LEYAVLSAAKGCGLTAVFSLKCLLCDILSRLYLPLECVDWFNNRRLLEPIGNVAPTEYELMYYQQHQESAMVA